MDNELIQTQTLQYSGFFLDRIQQLNVRILLEYHPWVGEKSEDRGFKVLISGVLDKAFQDFPMPHMHPVKSTDGNYGGMVFVICGNALGYDHFNRK